MKEKSMKSLKNGILWIILTIIVIFVIVTLTKIIILIRLQNRLDKYSSSENYHAKLVSYQGDNVTVYDTYKKNEKYLATVEFLKKDSNKKAITYSDGTTNNVYIEVDGQKIAQLNTQGGVGAQTIYSDIYTYNFAETLIMALCSSIKSADCNGKECYYIKNVISSDIIGTGRNVYIDKQTGLLVRATGGVTGSEVRVDLINDYSYEFDTVTDNDLKEPDVSLYKINENS